jgi:hypothetical protein
MPKGLAAIALIFICASFAWFVLGETLVQRTDDSDASQQSDLLSQWGSAQVQKPPEIEVAQGPNGTNTVPVPLASSRINVNLQLQQRRKGLLWYNLYDVDFSAHYTFKNPRNGRAAFVVFALPAKDATYEDFSMIVGGRRVDNASAFGTGDHGFPLAAGPTTTVDLNYRTRGMDSWAYQFSNGVASVEDFALAMTTNFKAIDFPAQTLLPTLETPNRDGWHLAWQYSSLVTGNGIGLNMPTPLQPGPLAQRITFWAPVALLFYLFVMLMVTIIRGNELHPMNYFFLACAFFAFHLLFAYLVDRISIDAAFAICSLVSMGLTISYLRLVAGWRFAAIEGGITQFIYLILFSYALFNEGWSGLTITIGAITTLFVAMQLTGRIRWEQRAAAS